MTALLALHGVLAFLAVPLGRRMGPRVFLVCGLAPLATFAWVLTRLPDAGEPLAQTGSWVPELGLVADLRLDAFALVLLSLISGVGVAVFAYSASYFSDRPGLGRFAGTLTLFAGAMLGIVLADNLVLLYVFWELTSVTSYLLIGFEDRKGSARAAALQAILVTGSGGLAMLAGFVLIGQEAGTWSLSAVLADPPTGATTGVALVLVLLGAFTKSAQVPFHSWLPGAMAAPTPVSAYLHSATMVKAGIYLIARFSPAFAPEFGFWRPLVMGVGILTMVLGGWRALRQHDLKLLLAFGTVSQLGFIVALVGAGIPALTFAGAGVLLAHGLFKSALFLVVGIVDHQAHTRDLRRLSGIGRSMPVVAGIAILATASMAGLPPLLGFMTKEAAYEGALHEGLVLAVAGLAVGSALTVAYGARFLWGAFATKAPEGRDLVEGAPAPPAALVAPALALAAATVVLSVLPSLADRLVGRATDALGDHADVHLVLWHGLGGPLVLSIVSVGLGAVLFLRRTHVESLQDRLHLPSAQDAYEGSLSLLNRTADRTTGIVQNGSLPVYIGVILLTLLALPGTVLLTSTSLPGDLVLAESPLQALVLALVLVAAVATARARRRFVAVLCLGAVGFGVAVVFVQQGAPDLALTQLLVETLAVVLFVLVLRHLPDRFEPAPWRAGNLLRLAVAAGVGVFITSFALIAAASRTAPSVSEQQIERALPEGGGRNVVNVILTDMRGLDTLGEITVLSVAALGVASLVISGRNRREEDA